jgi:hypothetical protein
MQNANLSTEDLSQPGCEAGAKQRHTWNDGTVEVLTAILWNDVSDLGF